MSHSAIARRATPIEREPDITAEKIKSIEEKLGAAFDTALSDVARNKLVEQGIIDQTEADLLARISQLGVEQKDELRQALLASQRGESSLIDNILEAGALNREQLEGGRADITQADIDRGVALDKLRSSENAAINAIQDSGAIEGSDRAIQFQHILSGIATPSETEDFISRFGPIEDSFTLKRQLLELNRRQKALGIRRSGRGLFEFADVVAKEQERLFTRAGIIAERGIEARRDIAGIRKDIGIETARLETRGIETGLTESGRLREQAAKLTADANVLRTQVGISGIGERGALARTGLQQQQQLGQFQLQAEQQRGLSTQELERSTTQAETSLGLGKAGALADIALGRETRAENRAFQRESQGQEQSNSLVDAIVRTLGLVL